MKRFNSDSGVTFVETAASLLILSAVMIALFRLSTTLIPSLEENRRSIITQGREIVLRKALKQELAKVTPPWWLAEYSPEYDQGEWVLPWYAGVEDDKLTLSIRESSLHITTPHGDVRIPEIEDITLSLEEQIATISLEGFITDDILLPIGSTVVPGKDLP